MVSVFKNPEILTLAKELIAAVEFCSLQGWTPATSSNFSVRSPAMDGFIITQSGVNKNKLSIEDLMWVDSHGKTVEPRGAKPSAETGIHQELYNDPEVHCVLHTHSPLATALSLRFSKEGFIEFSGYEVLKALPHTSTHETTSRLPIVSNSQSMEEIWGQWLEGRKYASESTVGFLIAGHGLYTWGKDIKSALRHIEAYEFLMSCYFHELQLSNL